MLLSNPHRKQHSIIVNIQIFTQFSIIYIYSYPAIFGINIKGKLQHTFTTDKYESVRPTYFPTIAILTCEFQNALIHMHNIL